jgi:hypothetical protein
VKDVDCENLWFLIYYGLGNMAYMLFYLFKGERHMERDGVEASLWVLLLLSLYSKGFFYAIFK